MTKTTRSTPQAQFDLTTLRGRAAWARTRAKLTQKELAKAAGVSQGTVGNLEAGIRDQPRRLNAIARTLGVRVEWLEEGKGEPVAADSANSPPNQVAAEAAKASQQAAASRPTLSAVPGPEESSAEEARAQIAAKFSPKALALATAYDSGHDMKARIQNALELVHLGHITNVSPRLPPDLHKAEDAPAGRHGHSASTPPGQDGPEGAGKAKRHAGKKSGSGDDGRH